jgi:cysteinyl-tRNA synthetase
MVGDEKMSKSLGNFTSLTDLLARTDPRAYRLLVIRSHYRSPIEVSPATIADAERALARLDTLARRFDLPVLAGENLVTADEFDFAGRAAELTASVGALLDDDLNTPLAVAALFDAVSEANTLADQGQNDDARALALAVNVLFAALGLSLIAAVPDVDEEVESLVAARDEARESANWARADQLRDELVSRGWVVEDSTEGTRIRRG